MSRWRDTCAVHPAADVFPMMSDEEIDDLAADIKKHGLSHTDRILSHDEARNQRRDLDEIARRSQPHGGP